MRVFRLPTYVVLFKSVVPCGITQVPQGALSGTKKSEAGLVGSAGNNCLAYDGFSRRSAIKDSNYAGQPRRVRLKFG